MNLGIRFPITYELDIRKAFLFRDSCLGFLCRRERGRSPPLEWGGFRSLESLAGEHGLDPILPFGYRLNERGGFVADLPHVRTYGIAVRVVVGKWC